MPFTEIPFIRRDRGSGWFDSRFGTEMGDDAIIPGVAILVTKHYKMIRHRRIWIRCFQPIAQLSCFTESGLGEMDMIHISPFADSGGCRALYICCSFW